MLLVELRLRVARGNVELREDVRVVVMERAEQRPAVGFLPDFRGLGVDARESQIDRNRISELS